MKHRTAKNDIVKNAAIKPMSKTPVDVKAFLRQQKADLEKSIQMPLEKEKLVK